MNRSSPRRRFAVLVFALAMSCGGDDPVSLLPEVPHALTAGTEVLLIGTEDGALLSSHVFDLGLPDAYRFELPEGARRFEAIVLPLPAEFVEVVASPDEASGRPPLRYRAFVARASGSRPPEWTETTEPLWAEYVRVAASEPSSCLLAGGCADGAGCRLPCDVMVGPVAPSLPDLAAMPCPAGWTETLVGTDTPTPVTVCLPWSGEGPECAFGEIPRAGGTCGRIAPPCPVDTFPDAVPGRAEIYVRPDALPGGDGSRGAPFAALEDALVATSSGATVVLGAGLYDFVSVEAGVGVEIVGACPERTQLAGSLRIAPRVDVQIAGVAFMRGDLVVAGTARVRGAVFEVASGAAIEVEDGGSLEIEDVDVRRAGTALTISNGRVSGSGLAVASPEVVIDAVGAEVDLTEFFVAGGASAPELRFARSTISLGRSFFAGASIEADHSNVDLSEVVFVDAASDAAVLAIGGELGIQRVGVIGGLGGIVVQESDDLSLTDLVVTNVDGAAVLAEAKQVVVERFAAIEIGAGALDLSGFADATLGDLLVVGAGKDVARPALALHDGGDLRVGRVFVSEHRGLAVDLRRSSREGASYRWTIVDVTLRDSGDDDCWRVTGVTMTQVEADLMRLDAVDLSGTAVQVDDARVLLSDARIARVATRRCVTPTDGPERGTALAVLGAEAQLFEFDFSGADDSGIRIVAEDGVSPRLFANHGVVSMSDVGLDVVAAVDYASELILVDLSDNRVPVRDLYEGGP